MRIPTGLFLRGFVSTFLALSIALPGPAWALRAESGLEGSGGRQLEDELAAGMEGRNLGHQSYDTSTLTTRLLQAMLEAHEIAPEKPARIVLTYLGASRLLKGRPNKATLRQNTHLTSGIDAMLRLAFDDETLHSRSPRQEGHHLFATALREERGIQGARIGPTLPGNFFRLWYPDTLLEAKDHFSLSEMVAMQDRIERGAKVSGEEVRTLLSRYSHGGIPPAARAAFEELMEEAGELFGEDGKGLWKALYQSIQAAEASPPPETADLFRQYRVEKLPNKSREDGASGLARRQARFWRAHSAHLGSPALSSKKFLDRLILSFEFPHPAPGLLAPGSYYKPGRLWKPGLPRLYSELQRRAEESLNGLPLADPRLARALGEHLEDRTLFSKNPRPPVDSLEILLQLLRVVAPGVDSAQAERRGEAIETGAQYLPMLDQWAMNQPDAWRAVFLLSALADGLDFGSSPLRNNWEGHPLSLGSLKKTLAGIQTPAFDLQIRQLKALLQGSRKSILFVADGAGETAVDLILIKQLCWAGHDVTLVGREHGGFDGISDGEIGRLLNRVPVKNLFQMPPEGSGHLERIPSGGCVSAADFRWATEDFLKRWLRADVRIVKGHLSRDLLANNRLSRDVFYLFQAQENGLVIPGLPAGSFQLLHQPAGKPSSAGLEELPLPGQGVPANPDRGILQEIVTDLTRNNRLSSEVWEVLFGFLYKGKSFSQATAELRQGISSGDLKPEFTRYLLMHAWIQATRTDLTSLQAGLLTEYADRLPEPDQPQWHESFGGSLDRRKNLKLKNYVETLNRLAQAAEMEEGHTAGLEAVRAYLDTATAA